MEFGVCWDGLRELHRMRREVEVGFEDGARLVDSVDLGEPAVKVTSMVYPDGRVVVLRSEIF